MAKVLGHDYSSTASLGSNATGSTGDSNATVVDHEGLVKDCLANETRFQGARRVENAVDFSEDFANAYWTKSNCTLVSGKADPLGGNNAYEMTGTASLGAVRRYRVFGTAADLEVRTSIWIRSAGSATQAQLYNNAGSAGTTVTITGAWQRFSVLGTTTGSDNTGVRVVNSGDVIEIFGIQAEDVTGQINQNPGDYVSVGVYRENIITHSCNFTNTAWSKISSGTSSAAPVVTSNDTDGPESYDKADKIEFVRGTGAGAYSIIRDTFTPVSGETYTFSVWLKAVSGTPKISIWIAGTSFVSTRTDITLSTTWTRYSITDTATSTAVAYFSMGITTNNLWEDEEVDLYAWGAQAELASSETDFIYTSGSTVKDYDNGQGVDNDIGVQYFPTTNPNTVFSNVVTEGTGTALTDISMLLEPTKKNMLLDSANENMYSTGAMGRATATGITNVYGIEEDVTLATPTNATAQHYYYVSTTVDSADWINESVYLKAPASGYVQYVQLYDNRDASNYAVFDIVNGTITYDPASCASIEELSNGWYRCSIDADQDITSSRLYIFAVDSSTAARGASATFNGTDVFYLCYPQVTMVTGVSSFIKTTGTAVTRTTDTAISYPLTTPQSAGTAVIEFGSNYPETSSGAQGIITFDDVTGNGPLLRLASSAVIEADDGTNSATDTATADVTAFAARWDDTSSGEMQVGFRTGTSTWAWGTASAAYDGGFTSDNTVRLFQGLADAANVANFDVYDDAKTTTWIEDNYPPSAGGVTQMPPPLHKLDNQFATITAHRLNGVLQ